MMIDGVGSADRLADQRLHDYREVVCGHFTGLCVGHVLPGGTSHDNS